MIRFFLIFAFVLGSARAANATICTIPTTLVNGSIVDAAQLNGNFTSLQSCGNAVDSTNIGSGGIFASQIKPTSAAQASFGGIFVYAFPAGLTINGALLKANSGLTVVGATNLAATTFSVAPTMSGANITAATIPNSALASGPGVSSVTGSGNIASSGGATPNITITNSPTFPTSVTTDLISFTTNQQVGNDHATSAGMNFFVGPAAPTFGYRFFTNSVGTVNQVFSINVNAVSGGPYTTTSDRRLKRDITPYTRGLDTIMALRPVRFVWRNDSKKSMGFIAQDVQKVLPELVTSTKLKGKVTLGVNYSAIVAPLVAAVQEQQREIVELRAEVKALRQAK